MNEAGGAAPHSTKKQYGEWANAYDRDTASYGWSAPQRLVHAVADQAPIRGDQRVLDVGVGTGLASEPYVNVRAQVTGLDISPEMLAEAKEKHPGFHHLAQYDINEPLETAGVKRETYDVVLSAGTLHFSKDLDATLGRLGGAVSPGGTLAFTAIPIQDRKFGPSTTPMDPEAVKATLGRLGFDVTRQERFIAYFGKGDENDPVFYEMFVGKKCGEKAPMPAGTGPIERSSCVDRARIAGLAKTPLFTGPQLTKLVDANDAGLRQELSTLTSAFAKQLDSGGELDVSALPLPTRTAKSATQGAPGCDALALFAHPDDESVFAGGTLARLCAEGNDVRLVSLTDGGGGRGGDNTDLVALRSRELHGASDALGLRQHAVRDFPDVGKYRDDHRAEPLTAADTLRAWGADKTVEATVKEIRRARPRALLTFDPYRDPNYSLHGHHLATGAAALLAFHLAADPKAFPAHFDEGLSPWAVPEMLACVPPGARGGNKSDVAFDAERKRAALAAHGSQGFSLERALENPGTSETWHRIQARGDDAILGGLDAPPAVRDLPAARPKLLQLRDEGDATATQLYQARAPKKVYADLMKRDYPRDAIADLIGAQMTARGADAPAQTANLDKLRNPKAVVVVTGQQTGVLGGPLYSLFKALGAVQHAKELSDQGIPTVPVFWMASYDHDLKEVAQATLVDGSANGQVVQLSDKPDERPVGDRTLGASVTQLVDDLDKVLDGAPFKDDAMALVRDTYRPDATFAEAFSKLLGALTDDHGLLLLDPNRREFAAHAKNVVRKELFAPVSSQSAIEDANASLDQLGFKQQVRGGNDRLNIFFIDDDGKRVFLKRAPGGFDTGGTPSKLSHEEAERLIDQAPERFSPSALLRPVVEDAVLPTMAYVGGAAECAYFAQIGGVYDWAKVPMPAVEQRPAFSVARAADVAALEQATGRPIADLLADDDVLTALGKAGLPPAVRNAYAEVGAHAEWLQTIIARQEAMPRAGYADLAADVEREHGHLQATLDAVASAVADAGNVRLQKGLEHTAPRVVEQLGKAAESLRRAHSEPAHLPSRKLLSKAASDLRGLVAQAIKTGRQLAPELVEALSCIQPKGKPVERQMTVAQLIGEGGLDVAQRFIDDAQLGERKLVTVDA